MTTRYHSQVSHDSSAKHFEIRPTENPGDMKVVQNQDRPPLNKQQIVTIVVMAVVNYSAALSFSIIAPFFPGEAEKKGVSAGEIGFIFGIFELVIFLCSPFFGRVIPHVGAKFMYVSGSFTVGTTCILFGFTNLIEGRTMFTVFCFLVRIFEAVGCAATVTASFAITATSFKGRVSMLFGFFETCSGLGLMTGPPVGGALYEIGGFVFPFAIIGAFFVMVAIFNFFMLPAVQTEKMSKEASFVKFLREPGILICIFSVFTAAVVIGFIEPALQSVLTPFGLSAFQVGLMFVALSGSYAIFAPFLGWFVDKKGHGKTIMTLGCIWTFLALNLIGPVPILNFQPKLWLIGVSLGLIALGAGSLFVPSFKECLDETARLKFPDSFDTDGMVSGLITGGFSFGAFFGPTVGGYLINTFGFPASASYLSFLNILTILILITSRLLWSWRDRSRLKEESVNLVLDPKEEENSYIRYSTISNQQQPT